MRCLGMEYKSKHEVHLHFIYMFCTYPHILKIISNHIFRVPVFWSHTKSKMEFSSWGIMLILRQLWM